MLCKKWTKIENRFRYSNNELLTASRLFLHHRNGPQHVHLGNNDERLIIPIKQRFISPPSVDLFQHLTLSGSDKFLTEPLSKQIRKKHVVGGPGLLVEEQPAATAAIITTSKLKTKKCCRGNEWSAEDVPKKQEVIYNLDELFQPVSLLLPTDAQIHGYRNVVDDIKPVTEHIQDDLKYDFRTKTHSF